MDTLKRGIVQLTKIRHPRILTVQHPLEESRESLAFATEPVFASLANVLGQTINMPQPANLSGYKLFDVEIKYGLLQLAEGLTFLHNDVKLIHKNISPECIIINQQGAWKIFGFEFCVLNTSAPNATPNYPFEAINPHSPAILKPNIEFLSPECIVNHSHSPMSDMFSLGMLSYTLYSVGHQTLFPTKDFNSVKHRSEQLRNLTSNKLACVPELLRESVKILLNTNPQIRPDAHQFCKVCLI